MHQRRHFRRKPRGEKEETLNRWIEACRNWKAQMMKLIITLTNVRKDIRLENGPIPSQVFLILLILFSTKTLACFHVTLFPKNFNILSYM